MLQTLDEIKKVELSAAGVINGVDNANLMSVDSTTPITTEVDEIKDEEEKENKEVVVPEKKEVKEDKKEDEKIESSTAVEARIGKLTKKWRTAEREAEFQKSKRLEAEEELTKLKSSVPSVDKPKREDFEDEASFYEALTDWKVENKLKATQVDSAKKTEDSKEQQAAQDIEQELEEISDRGREKFEEYDKFVFDKDLPLTQGMIETIILSDIAEYILYYLGKHQDEAVEISEMSVLKAAKEIGKIEAKLVAEIPKLNEASTGDEEDEHIEKPPAKEVAPVKKLTKTPEPISPVKATGVTEKDPSQMSAKEYRAWRERQK